MFTLPRPNVYQSSEGFCVEVLGRTGIRYDEGGRVLTINSEVLMDPDGIGIYKSSLKQWDAPNAESIGDADRDRILNNIRAAFLFRGFEIVVI